MDYERYFRERDPAAAEALLSRVCLQDEEGLASTFNRLAYNLEIRTSETVLFLERFRVVLVRLGIDETQADKTSSVAAGAFRTFASTAVNDSYMRLCCEDGHVELVDKLNRDYGLGLETTDADYHSYSLLQLAILSDRTAMALWIIGMKGLLDHKETEHGRTALHLSCLLGRREVTKALLKAGAQINVLDRAGCSVLHLAASQGEGKTDAVQRSQMVRYLMKQGVNAQIGNDAGLKASAFLLPANLVWPIPEWTSAEYPCNLPRDVWLSVFSWLSDQSLLQNVAPVCKAFHSYANEAAIRHFKGQ